MANFLNMDLGSLFGKKEENTEGISADGKSLQLVEKIPVRTMKQDLKELAFPTDTKNSIQTEQPTNNPLPTKNISTEIPVKKNISDSPFFEQKNSLPPIPKTSNGPVKIAENQVNISNNQFPPIPKKETLENPNPVAISNQVTENKANPQKIIAIALSLFVIIVLAGGGYYFWTLNQKPTEMIPPPSPMIPEEVRNPKPEIPPVVPEVPKPKYMNFDIQNSTSADLIQKLKTYISEATSSGELKTVEYIVSDMQNNPITFSDFSTKFGIRFSTEIMANLSDPFSLFIYTDASNPGIGLAVTTKNEALLKKSLLAAEQELVSSLTPILLSKPAGEINKNKIIFGDNTYKEMQVRYYNIVSPKELCVDYSVFNGKLLIGTTMSTLRAVYDYLQEEGTTVEKSKAVPEIPATSQIPNYLPKN